MVFPPQREHIEHVLNRKRLHSQCFSLEDEFSLKAVIDEVPRTFEFCGPYVCIASQESPFKRRNLGFSNENTAVTSCVQESDCEASSCNDDTFADVEMSESDSP